MVDASSIVQNGNILVSWPEHLVQSLVCQLDTQKGSGIRRHCSCQSGSESWEEGSETTLAVQLADDSADADVALGRLQPRLDGIDGEDGNPHGHTSGGAGTGDGREAEVSGGLAGDGVLGAQLPLDVLVGGKVGSRAGSVAGQSGHAAPEDAAHAALAVQLTHHVDAAAVLGLLAGRELLLALDLQDDLYALEGGRDGGHGYGGEEAGGGDLGDGQAVGGHGGKVANELLAEIVAPEGDGDCFAMML